MTALAKITLHNFRSYTERTFEFSPQVTVITGKNGIGKTNILEAVYTLYQGKSFRAVDEQLVRHDAEWWKVTGFLGDQTRELRYQPGQLPAKQLVLDGGKKTRFTYKQQLPVVLFEPNHLLLFHGSPSLRRSYIDTLLTQTDPSYRKLTSQYERALLQRNNLLKRASQHKNLADAVFVWDVALAEYGSNIVQKRLALLEQVASEVEGLYRAISGDKSAVDVGYETKGGSDAHKLAALLSQQLDRDVQRGFTSVGPHRDDINFTLRSNPVRNIASRGEVRTLLLALKTFELRYAEKTTGVTPLFLLDDVFSELDEERRHAILSGINQTIITTTDKQVSLPGQQEIILQKSH